MEFKANFGIEHGSYHKSGRLYPENTYLSKKIFADNEEEAMSEAVKIGREFSLDYLIHPDSRKTTVTLRSLQTPTGNPIAQSKVNTDPTVTIKQGSAVFQAIALDQLLHVKPEQLNVNYVK